MMRRLFGKTRRDQGDAAEALARDHLQRQGLAFVAQNVQSRFGEIDLIMREGDTLVFVEVRYRGSMRFGGAAASVDARKQRRLIATAQRYLQQRPHDGPCRFDVVALGGGADEIEWLRNAFEIT